jgi:hypothetical protein
MIRLTRFSRILLTGFALLYVQITAAAAVITSVYYVAEDGLSGVSSLRSVGFDGTDFIGSFSVIQPVDPDWTAMHYDTAAGVMYYVAEDGLSGVSSLRSVGFDGTDFIGSFSVIQPVDPDWTAMSLVFGPSSEVPEPGTIVLLALSLAGVAATRRRKN